MDTTKNSKTTFFGFLRSSFTEPLTIYTLIISFSISLFIILEAVYPRFVIWTASQGFFWLQAHYPIFVTEQDKSFSQGFVEWFGVFYSFLLPLLLVRAWEQLDNADREFDREADAIKVLLEDIMLLDDKNFLAFKFTMVRRLYIYTRHVLKRHTVEHLKQHMSLKTHGDNLLQGIRAGYKKLIYRGGGKKASQLEPVTTELLERLNEAIDVRGDRIAIFGQRLFESLRIIATLTSVIWLIPFYFLPFQSGILGVFLKLSVTFLIIFVLTVIDDLDGPFTGYWTITIDSWRDVEKETKSSLDNLVKAKEKAAQKKPVKRRKKTSQVLQDIENEKTVTENITTVLASAPSSATPATSGA